MANAKHIPRWRDFRSTLSRRGVTTASFLLLGATAAVFFFAPGGSYGLSESSNSPETSPGLSVKASTVEIQREYRTVKSFIGRVEAARSSELGFEIAGLVTEVRSDEGDQVNGGEILARLDTERLRSRRQELAARRDQATAQLKEMKNGPRQEDIAEARANVEHWRAKLELARLTSDRVRTAASLSAVSSQEWDNARLNMETVAAQLSAAREQLEKLETGTRYEQIEAQEAIVRQFDSQIATVDVDIRKSRLIAPYSGRIAKRLIDEGQVLTAGQPVVRLLEDAKLEVRVGVARKVAAALQVGSPAQIVVTGIPQSAYVKAVLPERERRTRTVTVLFRVEGDVEAVQVGDVAELRLEQAVQGDGFWLPLTALSESIRGLWSAYALVPEPGNASGFRVEQHQVELIHTETYRAYVRGTIADGDLVVIQGVHRLTPGQVVALSL